jgi:ABC-2 type transport system permease protein
MNTPSNAAPESPVDPQQIAPAAMSETRPLYWSIRRELWENRSIYIAPLVVAGLVLFGFLIATIGRAVATVDPAQKAAVLVERNGFAAGVIMATAFIVGVFYCLDALHGERRDRSILFWKSLPVSDLTTVLSKASIPLVVLPLITFAIVVATQLIMLLLSTAVLLISGLSAATPTQLPLFQQLMVLLYGLIALALWHAPIYGWLLLVSGWARRTTFLWAVLPPLALCIVEKIAFNTSHLVSLLKYRLFGFAAEAFAFNAHGTTHGTIDSLAQLTPGKFLSTPGLWIGLAFAAAFLAAAVRLRRYREPI